MRRYDRVHDVRSASNGLFWVTEEHSQRKQVLNRALERVVGLDWLDSRERALASQPACGGGWCRMDEELVSFYAVYPERATEHIIIFLNSYASPGL